MRNVFFIVLSIIFAVNIPVCAKDDPNDIVSLVSLTPGSTTPAHVTEVYGKPMKVEQTRRKSWWHYNHGNTNLVICWNKKSDNLEKFSFSTVKSIQAEFDATLYRKLKSGRTNILEALKLLGTPKDMTVKAATQEIYYAYRKNILRLFFRDRVLVDFTLLSTPQ